MDPNTPEKIPRTPSERTKRKRKVDDGGGLPPVGGKGIRTATSTVAGVVDTKKTVDIFTKHPGSSPIRHGGAKSPSPQQGYTALVSYLILNSNGKYVFRLITFLFYL